MLKFYPALLTGLAFTSIIYVLKPIYTNIGQWKSLREDRRVLGQRKRLFEMLVLTQTQPSVMEDWQRESLF